MKVFPSFRLDAVNQCVWRLGDTGREERILLTPKAFAVLAYLVDHAGRLVTHDELLEAVWPGSVVEPQAVKKHVLGVRTALGDRPKNSLYIETVTKRGYQFIAPVSEPIASSPLVPGRPAHRTLVGRGGAHARCVRETTCCRSSWTCDSCQPWANGASRATSRVPSELPPQRRPSLRAIEVPGR